LTNLIDRQTVTGNNTKMKAVEKGLSGLYVVILYFLYSFYINNDISYQSPGNNNFVLLQTMRLTVFK